MPDAAGGRIIVSGRAQTRAIARGEAGSQPGARAKVGVVRLPARPLSTVFRLHFGCIFAAFGCNSPKTRLARGGRDAVGVLDARAVFARTTPVDRFGATRISAGDCAPTVGRQRRSCPADVRRAGRQQPLARMHARGLRACAPERSRIAAHASSNAIARRRRGKRGRTACSRGRCAPRTLNADRSASPVRSSTGCRAP
ncbi:hypothetical protein WS86_25485 [Burkholderia savannae]|nr:hypothetical protein WS86_25485 [Burkholderia savannae]